jgi:ABC-type uncharacterized transport system ATPase component
MSRSLSAPTRTASATAFLRAGEMRALAPDVEQRRVRLFADAMTTEELLGFLRQPSSPPRARELWRRSAIRLGAVKGASSDSPVLLLDEPCSALDPISTSKIEEHTVKSYERELAQFIGEMGNLVETQIRGSRKGPS